MIHLCNFFRFNVNLESGAYSVGNYAIGNIWTHVALNYDGDGIKVYYDCDLIDSTTDKAPYNLSSGNGKTVIGKRFTNRDEDYSGFDIDELLLFNEKLTEDQIKALMENV